MVGERGELKNKTLTCLKYVKPEEREKHLATHLSNRKSRPASKLPGKKQCPFCDHVAASANYLSKHLNKEHDDYKCKGKHSNRKFCGKYFNHDDMKKHLEEYKSVCKQCGKAFKFRSGKSSLRGHKKICPMNGLNSTAQKQPFICLYCGKTFPLDRYCKYHIKSKHTDLIQVHHGK